MAPTLAVKDQSLITGRTAYGKASDGHLYPITVDTSGNVIFGAGTALVGKVGIDQTTPGTTNAVAVTAVKTVQTELLAIQAVAASTRVASTVLSLSGVKKATFFIDHGRSSSAAFGTNGTEYRIEVSQKATGNDTWRTIASVLADSAACLAVAASADVAAGGTTVVITSGTSVPTIGDVVFWANTVAATASEWMKVATVTGTASFTIGDGLTNNQDSDTNIFTKGEQFVISMDVEGFTRVRAIANNNASGTTLGVYSRIACITEQ